MLRPSVESPIEVRLPPTVQVESSGDELTIVFRKRSWGIGLFLLLWLTGWTAGCVALAAKVYSEPTPFHFLFALPFWAGELFVIPIMLASFLSREEIVLSQDGIVVRKWPAFTQGRRVVPLDEILRFSTYRVVVDSESGREESGLELESLGQPVRFLQGLDEAACTALATQFTEQLRSLRGDDPLEADADDAEPDKVARLEVGATEALERSEPGAPPPDCLWERIDDVQSIAFVQHGRLSLTNVGVMLFLNAFWNGIVGVFVFGLLGLGGPVVVGGEWWFLFFFLIPFELIGLFFLAALAMSLLEPVRRSTWSFGDAGAVRRTAWLGIGWTKTFDASSGISRIDLARTKEEPQTPTVTFGGAGSFRLDLVGGDAKPVCSLSGLTEGEARWIGSTLLREWNLSLRR